MVLIVQALRDAEEGIISRRMMRLPEFILFASEAKIIGMWGVGIICIALIALWAERKRMKNARIDGIGWMPWTNIFMVSAIIGAGLLALSAKGLLAG